MMQKFPFPALWYETDNTYIYKQLHTYKIIFKVVTKAIVLQVIQSFCAFAKYTWWFS